MEYLQIIVTSVVSYAVLFALAELSGRKQIAQLSSFDYISGITIGSIAAEMATELEEPLQPLLAMAIYGLMTFGITLLSMKRPRLRRFLSGTPVIVMDNGQIFRENMRRAKLELSEFMSMCRAQGYFDLGAIQTAVFEGNGQLSILPVSARRPATPEDLSLSPEAEYISTELILDGRVLGENLHRMGLDHNWLDKQLKAQGYHSAREIFLAVCDREKNLTCYPVEQRQGKAGQSS